LESEGSPIDFRNIRIKELPSSRASEELSAPTDQHWRSLFTGLDLRGWRTNSVDGAQWLVEGERIISKARTSGHAGILWADSTFGDAEFVVDCRSVKSASDHEAEAPAVFLGAGEENILEVKLEGASPGTYKRFFVVVKGRNVNVSGVNEPARHLTLEPKAENRRRFGLGSNGGGVEFMNVYVQEL